MLRKFRKQRGGVRTFTQYGCYCIVAIGKACWLIHSMCVSPFQDSRGASWQRDRIDSLTSRTPWGWCTIFKRSSQTAGEEDRNMFFPTGRLFRYAQTSMTIPLPTIGIVSIMASLRLWGTNRTVGFSGSLLRGYSNQNYNPTHFHALGVERVALKRIANCTLKTTGRLCRKITTLEWVEHKVLHFIECREVLGPATFKSHRLPQRSHHKLKPRYIAVRFIKKHKEIKRSL